MTDITVRWAGPADASSSSTYKIERTLNNADWTTLAAAQAATSPYASVSSTLDGDHAYGVATISVVSGASFSSAGYGWLDDALVQWTGKSTNDLTGVTWHSGYETYASGTMLYEAHESYADTGVTVSLNAVLYRFTHTNGSGEVSAPTYLWYYSPPLPSSSEHCVVVVNINGDLDIEPRDVIDAHAYLAESDYVLNSGMYLDAATAAEKIQTTNAFGLAFFNCFRSSARKSNSQYVFSLDAGIGGVPEVEYVSTIPDMSWVLLSDIVDD